MPQRMRLFWASAFVALLAADAVPLSRVKEFPSQTAKARAETARWMAHENTWGYITTLNPSGSPDKPLSVEVGSFSDGIIGASTGRLWFYVMARGVAVVADSYPASLTISQAAISQNMTCLVGGTEYDPEDPMCAKITIHGTMTKAALAPNLDGPGDIAIGKQALFARHPQMKMWPADHGFEVYELKIEDIWMIDFYGGGSQILPKEYFANEPIHNVPKWPPSRQSSAPLASDVVLATFDGAASTTYHFTTVNDPVMGGASASTATIDSTSQVLVWQGEVAIVTFLKAPGFCTIRSETSDNDKSFPSLVGTSALQIKLKNAGAAGSLTNFEAQIHTSGEPAQFGEGSYSAKFTVMADNSEIQTVLISWSDFVFTWRGQKKEGPPMMDQLDKVTRIGLGSSGVAGIFDLHLMSFSAMASTSVPYIREPPPHDQVAARARWLVYNSLWTSVGTISVHLNGKPWGNVRSVADGVGANSTGLPAFYLPTPDPTSIDVDANNHATLSFSEASLVNRVNPKSRPGMRCGGMDAEDPTCARLHMYGKIRALTDKTQIDQAMVDLGARHPLAPWLATGGAHTGGAYYTIDVDSLFIIDYYGGQSPLSLKDYLAVDPQSFVLREDK